MATYTTFETLIQRVIEELRMEAGQSVQQYAEDVIARKMQRIFNRYFDDYWLPLFMTYGEVMPLDGTTGKVTTNLTAKIKRVQDIHSIFYGTEIRPLTKAPNIINPSAITGGLRRYWQPTNNSDDKIFRILPITTTGDLTVTYRTKPADFEAADQVKFDEDLLVAATCLDYIVDEMENEVAIKKWEQWKNDGESTLKQWLNKGPIPFGSSYPNPLTDWMTNP